MYQLKNDVLNVGFKVANQGLEIVSIKHKGEEVLYQQDGSWNKTWPILFPICGNVSGPFVHDEKEFHTPRHGFFAQMKDWDIKLEGETKAVCMFRAHNQFKSIYPFDFDLVINIIIERNMLTYTFEVINVGKEMMSYSFGHHPAFKVDKNSKVVFESEQAYVTKFGKGGTYIPNQEKMYAKEVVISEVDYSDSKSLLFDEFKLDSILYEYKNKKIKMSFDKEPYFVLWKATNDVDFICIEPYWGLPDLEKRIGNRFRDKLAMRQIDPGNKEVINLSIQIN
ncbi:hypothetical protein [Spiroplasma tabanidicola]|uniref:Aldose 1-epimerase n=1 Tax=Spiroplasma tabanidicola TaxID=324079 RepID=A0A6I6CDT5_9MOLU|nr:hypothetical protein [Spiroplasma tabanidicola]QGS52282.1 aldose 1-epimerase [Spiroplasma tabanidicola]